MAFLEQTPWWSVDSFSFFPSFAPFAFLSFVSNLLLSKINDYFNWSHWPATSSPTKQLLRKPGFFFFHFFLFNNGWHVHVLQELEVQDSTRSEEVENWYVMHEKRSQEGVKILGLFLFLFFWFVFLFSPLLDRGVWMILEEGCGCVYSAHGVFLTF